MSPAPKMSEIRAAMDQARNLAGREDTETFTLEAPGLLAQLVQYLDLYVGHEPTLAEEADYVRGQHRAEVLRAVVDRLTELAPLYGDSSTVNAIRYDLTAVAENEAQLSDGEPEPGDGDADTEPDSPAQRAAREIQDLHDPIVIGYVIGTNTLTLTLHPRTWQEWQAWQKRLGCPVGQTTYRGGSATAHGTWGHIPVHAHVVLDRLPQPTQPGDGA